MCLYRKNVLKSTEPGKFKFTWKLPDILFKSWPLGVIWGTIGETFTCVDIGKMFKELCKKNV
jgi:hypothetical protein